jgi:hypothetical protein
VKPLYFESPTKAKTDTDDTSSVDTNEKKIAYLMKEITTLRKSIKRKSVEENSDDSVSEEQSHESSPTTGKLGRKGKVAPRKKIVKSTTKKKKRKKYDSGDESYASKPKSGKKKCSVTSSENSSADSSTEEDSDDETISKLVQRKKHSPNKKLTNRVARKYKKKGLNQSINQGMFLNFCIIIGNLRCIRFFFYHF